MNDEPFDKEAEREKLREQFEREEERRQITQQMSELLLKGATMLNFHCADCASPIFRHEGREFCPTCGRTVDELQAAGATDAAAGGDDVAEEAPTEEPPEPSEEQRDSADQDMTQPQRIVPQSNAGESLEAAIARLSDRAATAEDPRQAAELLDAAYKAAETLALLEGR